MVCKQSHCRDAADVQNFAAAFGHRKFCESCPGFELQGYKYLLPLLATILRACEKTHAKLRRIPSCFKPIPRRSELE